MDANEIGENPQVPGEPHGDKPKRKMPLGQRITKENAKEFSIRGNQIKKLRKQARAKILQAMVTQLDLGDEMVKSIKAHDIDQVTLLEKAIRIVGLHHDQSEDSIQQIKLDANANVKKDTKVHLVIEDMMAPEPETEEPPAE